jgi:hypothetical protein
VVSLITDGHATDHHGRPYKRRRPLPAIIVGAAFAAVTIGLWTQILNTEPVLTSTVDCNNPPGGASALGTEFDRQEMLEITPAVLAQAPVRVFNANGEPGQASSVAAQLSDLGYASAPDVQAGNDPIYTDQNLQCQGQIRFGPEGRAAASAVWVVAPCFELVEDSRGDNVVDLALGTYFRDLNPSVDAENALQALQGSDPSAVDPAMIAPARAALC